MTESQIRNATLTEVIDREVKAALAIKPSDYDKNYSRDAYHVSAGKAFNSITGLDSPYEVENHSLAYKGVGRGKEGRRSYLKRTQKNQGAEIEPGS